MTNTLWGAALSLDLTPLPAFLIASLVVVLTPGVDSFLLLRTSLHHGRRAGLLALAGIHSASTVQMAAAISGLGTLIASRPAVLSAMKWIGAAYLLYLAGAILHGLWLTRKESSPGTLERSDPAPGNPYLRGLLSNITNPKMLLFSLAFLPQFVGNSAQPAVQLTVLGLVFLGVAAIWETTIVLAASRIAQRLQQPRVLRTLDTLSAAAFLTISIGLVTG